MDDISVHAFKTFAFSVENRHRGPRRVCGPLLGWKTPLHNGRQEFLAANKLHRSINDTVELLTLGKLRHRPMAKRRAKVPVAYSENIGAKYAMLADMDVTDFFALGKSLGICTRLVQTTSESQYIPLGLAHYDCGVLVVETRKNLDECKEAHKSMVSQRKAGTMRPGMDFYLCYGDGEDVLLRCTEVRPKSARASARHLR